MFHERHFHQLSYLHVRFIHTIKVAICRGAEPRYLFSPGVLYSSGGLNLVLWSHFPSRVKHLSGHQARNESAVSPIPGYGIGNRGITKGGTIRGIPRSLLGLGSVPGQGV